MLRHRSTAASGPHPATYILFRPPCTPRDDELFTTDLELSQPRALNYKMSCPALLGTASRKLQPIDEDRFADSDVVESDCDSLHESTIDSTPVQENHGLSKKRSFLLVDVLDSVEGRSSAKRVATCDEIASTSTESIAINNGNHTPSIRRHKSDFDMLYSSSRRAAPGRQRIEESNRDRRVAMESLFENERQSSSRGRQPQLRSKKSLLALSLETKRASSPSKSRLDQIDTERVTSFDALLNQTQHYKSAATVQTALDQYQASSEDRLHDRKGIEVDLQQNPNGVANNFSVQTARLKVMPREQTRPTTGRPLRHAKSARDILQKYSVNRQDLDKMPPSKSTIREAPLVDDKDVFSEKKIDRAEKRAVKEASLRSGLRNLLGMKRMRKQRE